MHHLVFFTCCQKLPWIDSLRKIISLTIFWALPINLRSFKVFSRPRLNSTGDGLIFSSFFRKLLPQALHWALSAYVFFASVHYGPKMPESVSKVTFRFSIGGSWSLHWHLDSANLSKIDINFNKPFVSIISFLHKLWLDVFHQGINYQLFICKRVFEMKIFEFCPINRIFVKGWKCRKAKLLLLFCRYLNW